MVTHKEKKYIEPSNYSCMNNIKHLCLIHVYIFLVFLCVYYKVNQLISLAE